MYGLPQAGKIANDQLIEFLKPHGYVECPITPGLWQHETRDIKFCLVVDYFGIQYNNIADTKHLLNILQQHYKVSVDWKSEKYLGMTLNWNYNQSTCNISMPGYVEQALTRFQHPLPSCKEDSPHKHNIPQYGAKTQYTDDPDNSPALDAANKKRVQEILETLLYYARAINPTMLPTIGTIAMQQAKPTQKTMQAITQLLNYCASKPNASVRYIVSDMLLHIESDASYLSAPKRQSRSTSFFYMSNKLKVKDTAPAPNNPAPTHNGAISIASNIMREVLSSTTEAELSALYHNGKDACLMRIAAEEMGHPQPPTPIVTNNTTAAGIANDDIRQKRSKAIDMRFYWIRDRVRQGQFIVECGDSNRADYFSKHHSATYHRRKRPEYVHDPEPDPENENYYACLENSDTEEKRSCGEGVFINGNPDSLITGDPVPCIEDHKIVLI